MAAKRWKEYKRRRECGSVRPCMRIHLNFCIEQGSDHFLKMKRECEMMSDNRLGSRRCMCPLVVDNLKV